MYSVVQIKTTVNGLLLIADSARQPSALTSRYHVNLMDFHQPQCFSCLWCNYLRVVAQIIRPHEAIVFHKT